MIADKKKILLIEPPFYKLYKDTYSLPRYPLSLGYLAGTIKKETDWDVMVFNADFSVVHENFQVSYLAGPGFRSYLNNLKDPKAGIWQEIRGVISEYNPSIVGITAKSQTFASACVVAKIAKEFNDKIMVVMGGPHSSLIGREIFKSPDIDISVKGEGENTIVELINAIATDKALNGIRGILYRKNGEIIENPARGFIEDLDSLCFPYESASQVLKDYNKYPSFAFKNIFTTRGCPFNCFYCGSRYIWGRHVRYRSIGNIIKEIRGLQEKGISPLHFDDDIFGVNKNYIKDLCLALIKHCPGIRWSCELHVKLADEEIISTMKSAGCFLIQVGVESGSNEILRLMRKNITIEEASRACKLMKKHNIEVHVFFMVGFPQETVQTLKATIRAMKKIDCDDLTYSVFTPYPGTESFEFCKKKGVIDDSYDVSYYNHQSPKNCFCINMSPARFRMFASSIEKMVDRRNLRSNIINRIKENFSIETLRNIKALGARDALTMGLRKAKTMIRIITRLR